MKKKLSSVVLSFILCLTCTFSPAFAIDHGSVSCAQQIAEDVLEQYGDGSYALNSFDYLYNTELQVEAICFNFSPAGYVIVNLNDYSVPEFSPISTSPFNAAEAQQYVYVGPLNYYVYTNDNTFINLSTNTEISYTDFNYTYTASVNAQAVETLSTASISPRGSTVEIFTSHTPVTWDSSYYCGVDGSAIILKYLDMYHESNLLNSSMDDNGELQAYLINNGYIPNTGTTSSDLVFGSILSGYTGLNGFFNDRNSSFSAYQGIYTSSNTSVITSSLSSNIPVLIGTNPADDWSFGDHWIIIYGYVIGTDSYFVVNDGFGNNGIYVTTADDHYDNYVYFQKG